MSLYSVIPKDKLSRHNVMTQLKSGKGKEEREHEQVKGIDITASGEYEVHRQASSECVAFLHRKERMRRRRMRQKERLTGRWVQKG